jgi:hypothetical protein
MLVDKYAQQPRHHPQYQLQTFYGQLQKIFVIPIDTPQACQDLGLLNTSTIILAAIRTCNLDAVDPQLQGLDIWYYSSEGALHVVDITSMECLVGHIQDWNKWAIIDCSGTLAQAVYSGDEGA